MSFGRSLWIRSSSRAPSSRPFAHLNYPIHYPRAKRSSPWQAPTTFAGQRPSISVEAEDEDEAIELAERYVEFGQEVPDEIEDEDDDGKDYEN